MVMIYRLTPINPEHESWKRSKVKKQAVRVLAHDCADARSKVAKATETLEEIEFQSPRGRFAPLVYEKLPWELSDVTSCEPDDSGAPMPANDIVTEDGRQFMECGRSRAPTAPSTRGAPSARCFLITGTGFITRDHADH
jgi:hypothetical protein